MTENLYRLVRMAGSPGRSERGAGLAEYGMLMFFILFACLVIMGTFGQTLANQFQQIDGAIAGLN